MSKRKQVLGASVLATAVVAALSAFASGYVSTGRLSPLVSGSSVTGISGRISVATPGASGAQIVPLAGVGQQTHFNRFIVRYKDGAAAPRGQAAVLSSFNASAQRAGVAGLQAGTSSGAASVLGARYV